MKELLHARDVENARTSSHSFANGNCVKVGKLIHRLVGQPMRSEATECAAAEDRPATLVAAVGRVGVYDSVDATGPALGFDRPVWDKFLDQIKADELVPGNTGDQA